MRRSLPALFPPPLRRARLRLASVDWASPRHFCLRAFVLMSTSEPFLPAFTADLNELVSKDQGLSHVGTIVGYVDVPVNEFADKLGSPV